jgi:nucleoside-diphosphate-sugar epimerase
VRGDIGHLGDLLSAIHDHHVTSIVHLAAVLGAESTRSPEAVTRTNILGTANVFESARLGGISRVLFASSVAVYGSDEQYDMDSHPITEEAARYMAPALPLYATSKVYGECLAEKYAESYGLATGGLRLSTVYGPGRERGSAVFLSQLIERSIQKQPVVTDLGDAVINLVYVDDVAEQFRVLLEADEDKFNGHRFFNTGGDCCSVRDVASAVTKLLPDSRIDVRSSNEKTLAGMAADVSDDLLVRTFGFRRRYSPIERGIEAFIAASTSMSSET